MEDELDPSQLTRGADLLWVWAASFLPHLVAALVILVVGAVAGNWAGRTLDRVLTRAPQIDPTLRPFLASLVRYAVVVLAVVAALAQLGVQTTELLAVLGAIGLAIGLALQGTLSNIAAGLMLLWLRPFHHGDFIEVMSAAGIAGTVREIGLFVCKLETFDGLFLFVPNSTLWNAPLKNHTRNSGRMVSMTIALPAGADSHRARQALLEMGETLPGTLKAPAIFIDNLAGGNVLLNFVLWTSEQSVGGVQRVLAERVRSTLTQLGPDFAPATVTRIVPPDSDPSRLSAAPH